MLIPGSRQQATRTLVREVGWGVGRKDSVGEAQAVFAGFVEHDGRLVSRAAESDYSLASPCVRFGGSGADRGVGREFPPEFPMRFLWDG